MSFRTSINHLNEVSPLIFLSFLPNNHFVLLRKNPAGGRVSGFHTGILVLYFNSVIFKFSCNSHSMCVGFLQ